ncbi:short-chain dehydrogenase [Devosia epidermidihirudinis]|uniref:Short-chain dehydrogenase n=1 Tax=Devosia epidermidihirudinis TaxID=1293439 RepID=A0A0F5QKF9_9HYPH|nr:SDR family oxidoreductase [Devosia epidermidihirudinis]KKC41450.1 short-chain dehydrogenase [Devosia epidermidihirudinis]
MTDRLKGKRAIVTGAGQGIGEAIARAFAREGAAVIVAEKNAVTGDKVAADIRANGGVAHSVPTDVTDKAAVEQLHAKTIELLGGIDILVNNAGANVFHEPLAMPEEEWERCFKLDLEAAWSCARAVLPHMLEQGGGSIVNIASTHSFKIIPHTFPYPVAKHALIGLTRALAIEYAAQGVRVNAIAPGYIMTPIAEAYWNTFPDPAAEKLRAETLHPPRRIGRPEEVANTAIFLASDEAPFINAETIMIDGGRSALYHD